MFKIAKNNNEMNEKKQSYVSEEISQCKYAYQNETSSLL